MVTKSKLVVFSATAIVITGIFMLVFSAPSGLGGETARLVVSLSEKGDKETVRSSIAYLYDQGVIRNKTAFYFLMFTHGMSNHIDHGAYVLAKNWNALKVLRKLKSPDEIWIVIKEGLRKEEIAQMFAEKFGWSDEVKEKWVREYTNTGPDYTEGVYFPDTYLIPVDDEPTKVAERLLNRFSEKFAPYQGAFIKEDIRWPTALKIASIVQREAAGKDDMPVIAGVIWNRLLKDMKLDVDATVQYARGDVGNGWWAPITKEDKKIDSPYNTYLYKGLPPRPIDNPGIDAIESVLRPAKTKCLYYLHDNEKKIHCAETYEGHLSNIEKYLK